MIDPERKPKDEFDPLVLELSEEEWGWIERGALEHDQIWFWKIVEVVVQLDKDRAERIITEEDWTSGFKEVGALEASDSHAAPRLRYELIASMARVDRQRAQQALQPSELEYPGEYLRGAFEDSPAKAYGHAVALVVENLSIYPDAVRRFFEENPDIWKSAEKQVSYYRSTLPQALFAELAALAEIDPKQTQQLLRQEDWQLGLDGLAHYRKKAEQDEGQGGSGWLLAEHVLQLRKLAPLFEEQFFSTNLPDSA